jgi:hypothetical protein
MGKIEVAIRIALRYVDAFNRHDTNEMANYLDESCVMESCGPEPDGKSYSGTRSIKEYLDGLLVKIPGARIHVEEAIGFGNTCVVRWIFHIGTDSTRDDHCRGMEIFETRKDLITRELSYRKA